MRSNKNEQSCVIVKVNDDGSIVLPKEIMETFKINVGDEVMLMGDKKKGGVAIVKNDLLLKMMKLKPQQPQ